MKKQKRWLGVISLLVAGAVLLSSCASTTMIQSSPSGADVFINGEKMGTTPYTYSDSKIVGSTTLVRLEKEGYEPLQTQFQRNEQADVGAIVAGVFVLVPFLWTMKYKPTRTYTMNPLESQDQHVLSYGTRKKSTSGKSKAERLKELKVLLDQDIITQAEFDAEKKKILAEDD